MNLTNRYARGRFCRCPLQYGRVLSRIQLNRQKKQITKCIRTVFKCPLLSELPYHIIFKHIYMHEAVIDKSADFEIEQL